MTTLKFQHSDSFRIRIAEELVENIKVFCVIKPLQKLFYDKGFYQKKLTVMRALPSNTIGNDIAKMLDANGLQLIPKYEEHDLKHLLLGYDMTTSDEIKMQAYLFGNGNYKLSCILFLSSGILFPSLWSEFYNEYKKGKKSPSIANLKINDCLEKSTIEIRQKYTTSI